MQEDEARRLEPVVDLASVLLLSIPEFLWGLILLFVFGVVLRLLPFTGELAPGLPLPHVTGFLLIDALLVGRFDIFVSACLHLILPALALGLAFSPTIMRVLWLVGFFTTGAVAVFAYLLCAIIIPREPEITLV